MENVEEPPEPPAPGLSTDERVAALADNVFAVVMTLLVLGLSVPDVPDERIADRLAGEVLLLWPSIAAYVVTFLVLGIYWMGHHTQYHFMRGVDRAAIWINIVFFMIICLVPFTTSLVSQYSGQAIAVTLYALNLIGIDLILLLHWRYAARAHLLKPDTPRRIFQNATRQMVFGGALFALAIPVAFVHPRAGLAVILLVPVLHILPGPIHIHWTR